ncbi:hypothetical protein SEVIR_9G176000v4 [Setaria viridis]|uniref:FRIGIDA-like protein n=1 Tax=Setaria viridis TaxID=4556 RepID=A0A4U6SX87_SETVI|nr:FRIGIDA-like protein 3 [Setaria viridis]XP_034572935.1 FRIGIDA-like protein 3 [Setaria viridis]XP_034572936.1 FRIGIDA-like protein 3 [Setaria viridis]XP_034572937.1 FRIGIDA-like protein 3 [Setaria viridis]TKV92683.1 hypothetical protein SEVIR_9G176000v2 [Setaria viridis]
MQSASQPTPTSLPPVPTTTAPAAAMATQAELEAAVAALPAKRRRLREAFDRLAACSPVPVPFRWEDLDAHLASVAARFGHFEPGPELDSPHAAGPATTGNLVEHLEEEEEQEQDRERRGERGAWEEGQGSNAEEGEEGQNASLDRERWVEEGEVREASSARPDGDREGDEAGNEKAAQVAIEASPERDEEAEDDAMGATAASPRQGDGDIDMMMEEAEEAVNASADRDGVEDDEPEEGELPRQRATAVGSGEAAPTRAVAAYPSALVGLLCLSGRSSLRARGEFLPTLLGAADPHALLVRAVGEFLASAVRKTNRFWENCVALIECAPRLAAPSADALVKAERVARDWKEMVVGKPWSCGDMSRMAGWGLLTFVASYNIALEFDDDEITCLFGNLAPQMKNNCVELCERLGLIEKMTDSINHFIENGQPLDAIRLAHTFNLTHKYPPLTIMKDYVENAKKTAEDILSKESYTLESLNQVMAKKVNALIFSWSAIDGCNIDAAHRNSIKAEITCLLHKYANKQQSLAGVSAFISSTHQQHNLEEQYHEQLQMPLEQQQQQKRPQELHQMPEEEQQQQKPHEMQQQHPQNRQEQGWVWQNRKGRKKNNKNRKRSQRRQRQQERNKRPRLSSYVRPGIHNQCGQPFSGTQRAPFTARTRAPPYFGPYDRSQP